MFKIENKQEIQNYQLEMYNKKINVQKEFFNASSKRRFIKPFLKNRFTRGFFERFTPYSYNDVKRNINYFFNAKIAIYTAIYGGYDSFYEPQIKPDNCDYFIFTDADIADKKTVWKKKTVDVPEFCKLSNAEKNRYIKMHPHILFPEYEYSIYIDGNIEVVTDFTELITDFNEYGLKLHNHFNRHCAYEEIQECIRQKKCPIDQLNTYQNKLLEENFPYNYGLLEAPVICRQHNCPKCIEIMDAWWDEYLNYIKRDQLALIYVLYHMGIKPKVLSGLGRDIHSNYAFIQHDHKK